MGLQIPPEDSYEMVVFGFRMLTASFLGVVCALGGSLGSALGVLGLDFEIFYGFLGVVYIHTHIHI